VHSSHLRVKDFCHKTYASRCHDLNTSNDPSANTIGHTHADARPYTTVFNHLPG